MLVATGVAVWVGGACVGVFVGTKVCVGATVAVGAIVADGIGDGTGVGMGAGPVAHADRDNAVNTIVTKNLCGIESSFLNSATIQPRDDRQNQTANRQKPPTCF